MSAALPLTVPLAHARPAFAESVAAMVRAAEAVPEYDLLGASRCHGWTRLDVVVHVIAGWHEMLGGLVCRVEAAPTVDAASYWGAFAAQYGSLDPVMMLMSQRRRSAAFARPAHAVEQLRDVGAALSTGVELMADQPCRWDGHVFTAGDFLTVWAVEDAVHHLDLLGAEHGSAAALALSRRTVEAIVGSRLPTTWSDEQAVLIGAGREPAPPDATELQDRLPAIG